MHSARFYPFSHSPLQCHFNASSRDFVVKEIPLYEPSGNGEHLLIYVRKKGLSTFEMLELFSQILGIKVRDIGYAGLKDKAATTYQYISISRHLESRLNLISPILQEHNIKILNLHAHNNKLKIGHLKGNEFFMRLKKLLPHNATKLESTLELIAQSGFPNYFGDQRFGKEGDNFQSGKAIIQNSLKIKNKKMSNFLISSYQSHLFNAWLKTRLQFSQILHSFSPNEVLNALFHDDFKALHSPHYTLNLIKTLQKQKQHFVLLQGDVMCHYPYGKNFICEDEIAESQRFILKNTAPTGALCGLKLTHAHNLAKDIESHFLDSAIKANGTRRYAWVWAEQIKGKYIAEKAQYELQFYLPKGSYATIFLESLLGQQNL
ncbi:tRNA pseudouridine(13) synthase TruD [Helicobacter cinaedi]|uniref:tRNA pseudouridine(13) synthase TruD n=1 Tax=Helicobacter cinaedi TaxID=213 RepID=UPI000CF03221|nr:tRNA pseudouridine(13) synthase TruD [Helicobacter cinaedi]AWK61316.1 tRNA pseudouridine(13) synthase TruD [Helicobacter cinaedi]QOQ96282.1 tRNA pseudouridine(13) synthase TruD [Helicobacter cinaedi]